MTRVRRLGDVYAVKIAPPKPFGEQGMKVRIESDHFPLASELPGLLLEAFGDSAEWPPPDFDQWQVQSINREGIGEMPLLVIA